MNSKVTALDAARERRLDSIEDIVADIKAGRMVIMMDDEDRENEGDLIMAAEYATPEAVAFIIRHSSGIICMPMIRERLEELRLPLMVAENTESHRTAFTISVDYRHGTTTGISAYDRSATVRALADHASKPDDFARPGHIFPLRYTEGGVLARAGHTEASIDLIRLAGMPAEAAIICEIVNDDGTMKRGADLFAFARENNLKIGTIADLIRYRLANEHSVERLTEQKVTTEFGEFQMVVYEDRNEKAVHLALVKGEIKSEVPTLVRVHISNTLQDTLGVQSEEFSWPLRRALKRVADEGAGIVVLLRRSESPRDLVQSILNLQQPHTPAPPVADGELRGELRTYGVGAQILIDLGVRKMRVLATPRRLNALSGFDLEVIEYVHCD
ncbi:MAG: 3,4-dihydroxy-2-butanone-4-phosphate synthase [Nevskia sp.]|jgi:3,4-dihydroxy 2-butanone 4-phosphate synthase / GTP cyclohydrolase II|nr:3,4-dihydroxy-2-butanone-4-phosphate synthase [Nevskia sp.]